QRRILNFPPPLKMGDLLDWIISFLFLVTLLIIVIYQLNVLADLEADHINPYDSSTKINRVILPEFCLQGLLIHEKGTFGRRYRDAQYNKGEQKTTLQRWSYHPLHFYHILLVDPLGIGRHLRLEKSNH
ncbi:hypothetical protein HID58_048169, partial [Brassica napus]